MIKCNRYRTRGMWTTCTTHISMGCDAELLLQKTPQNERLSTTCTNMCWAHGQRRRRSLLPTAAAQTASSTCRHLLQSIVNKHGLGSCGQLAHLRRKTPRNRRGQSRVSIAGVQLNTGGVSWLCGLDTSPPFHSERVPRKTIKLEVQQPSQTPEPVLCVPVRPISQRLCRSLSPLTQSPPQLAPI